MTDRRYLSERTLVGDARIVDVGLDARGNWAQLDRTWFHPQGGGQRADQGTIDSIPVDHVSQDPFGVVSHYFAEPVSFAKGAEVHLEVDPQSRLRNAQLHTAGHLIGGLGQVIAPGLRAVAGHHWDGEARVDFDGAQAVSDIEAFLRSLTHRISTALEEGLAVSILGDPESDRSIAIGVLDPMPCGGTHVSSLSEIGSIDIRKTRKKKGIFRVSYDVV